MYRTPVDIEEEDMPRWRFRRARKAAQIAITEPTEQSSRVRLTGRQQHAVGLYDDMERHRAKMYDAFRDLIKYIQTNPELRPAWDRFVSTGGASSHQLKQEFQRSCRPGQAVRRGLLRIASL